jgi:hypothetical protein
MNVGEGSYCPSCFDRAREENTGAAGTRYRDYATMAISAAVFGLLCSMLPFGAFAIYWGVKGVWQRRAEGTGIAGPVIAMILGALQTIAMLVFLTLMIIGMVTGSGS